MTKIIKSDFQKIKNAFQGKSYSKDPSYFKLAVERHEKVFEIKTMELGEAVAFILDQKETKVREVLGDVSGIFSYLDTNKRELHLAELWWRMEYQDYYFLIRTFIKMWEILGALPQSQKEHIKMVMEFRTCSPKYGSIWVRNENYPVFLPESQNSRYVPNVFNIIEGAKRDNVIRLNLIDYKDNLILFSAEEFAAPKPLPGITSREKQILDLMALGKNSRQIGEILSISHQTVKIHRSHLIKKCKVSNSIELIRTMIKSKVIEFP